MTNEGLKTLHRELSGAGYRPPFAGSKNLRDAESGVRIEFLVTGQFPGDGKLKPVAFPQPESAIIEQDGVNYVNLLTLIELKLASGITNPGRVKDLSDVQELIKLLALPFNFTDSLNPYVRAAYGELWSVTQRTTKRFLKLWRNELITVEAQSLQAMLDGGVVLEPTGSTDDYAYLVTTDPVIAKKYDMHDEAEFLSESED